MLLIDALELLTQGLYLVMCAVILVQLIRRPAMASFEIALFFGVVAAVIALARIAAALGASQTPAVIALTFALVMALPYLLLRLAAAFGELPPFALAAAGIGLGLSIFVVAIAPQPYPTWLVLVLVAYFAVLAVGAALAFVWQAKSATGVTRRRLQCVAWASVVLGIDILLAGLAPLAPGFSGALVALGGLCGLASGVLYFIGFAPPVWVRRAWQEPALRAFIGRSAQLAGEPDVVATIHELEDGAAAALGTATAIGVWLEAEGRLRFYLHETSPATRVDTPAEGVAMQSEHAFLDLAPGTMIAGQSFARQAPIFSSNAPRDDPQFADYYRSTGSRAALAAPITAATRRLGVMVGYAARAPVFADSDLELMQLLADQAAVVLQTRVLIEESARARAREESDRLKDEFLASVSHDLRNPLTAVQGVTQVLERRLAREMSVDPDRLAVALSNIRTSSTQMAGLIDQLLDYARMRMDRPLELSRRPTDLVDLARRSVESYAAVSDRHKLRFDSPPQPIVGEWDQPRLERVVQNLIGNAVKYSPDGGEIVVRAATSTEGNNLWAVLTVRDQGLGIPSEDVPLIFDRFHRAANVQQIAGTGLGLSAARQVVQQHGGSIDIASTEGAGTTVTVRLPLGGPDELPSGPDEPLVDQRTTSVKPTGELRVALQGGLN